MLSETSADFVDAVEHPPRVPAITTASKAKNGLNFLIFLL
jgi:hypothetical protein